MQPFLALITPIAASGAHPEHPIVYPPQPMPPIFGGVPTHPIYYPPSIWGPTDPRPGYGLPGAQPHPEHPIYYPPSIWGPTDPRPGYGLPPGYGIWGGSNQPFPTPPIVIPPKPTEPPEDGVGKPPPADGGWGYHPDYGWGYFPPKTEASPKG